MSERLYLNADCMNRKTGLPSYPDNYFDLAIVDPPYGIGETAIRSKQRVPKTQSKKWANRKAPDYVGGNDWDNEPPTQDYFEQLVRVSKNQIIWGANHFGMMPPSSGWVVWYKKRIDEVNDFSDAELAYTSFNKGCRLFHLPWIGFGAINAGEKRMHPTQKPSALYRWLLSNYARHGMRLLDTHVGSASSLVVFEEMGFDYVAFETDKDYYRDSTARLEKFRRQGSLFSGKEIFEASAKQTTIFDNP